MSMTRVPSTTATENLILVLSHQKRTITDLCEEEIAKQLELHCRNIKNVLLILKSSQYENLQEDLADFL